MKNLHTIILTFFVIMLLTTSAVAQLQEPRFKKVESHEADDMQAYFNQFNFSGEGLYASKTDIDRMPTIEVRARLQALFGEPTIVLDKLFEDGTYRLGKSIQFEYWFIIDGSIPLMLLDFDGPFGDGLVYVGASRFIDMMPEIKRSLTRNLTNSTPEVYKDYFFSPERNQWFEVSFDGKNYTKKEIEKPKHFKEN